MQFSKFVSKTVNNLTVSSFETGLLINLYINIFTGFFRKLKHWFFNLYISCDKYIDNKLTVTKELWRTEINGGKSE